MRVGPLNRSITKKLSDSKAGFNLIVTSVIRKSLLINRLGIIDVV
jgi:hypothetical protein